MRIVIDVPEYLVDRARNLIGGGTYRDLSSFVTASIENQLTLEESTSRTESLVLPEMEKGAAVLSGSSPLLAGHLAIPVEDLPTLEYPARPGESPAEQWPWGQINKLLPVKFAIRLLANSVSHAQPAVPLDEFKTDAAKKARVFGQWLKNNDDTFERRWGNRLSAGFPIGKRKESSLNRYASHFVGHHRKSDDALFGALFVLKFGNAHVVGRKLSVGLTEAGLRFARMPNPVFDDSDLSSSLGQEEIDSYLGHVRARVPGERYAFQLILSLLAEGVNGREELNQHIRNEVRLDWSDAVVNTQRAGAMARMSDLGLVDSERDGLRVEYRVTDSGLSWLRQK